MSAIKPLGPMVRIRVLRDAYGLTAEQVAERMAELGVPVDRNSLYNIERGAKKPSDRVLDAYARALGVNPLDVWQGPLRTPVGGDGQAGGPPPSPASTPLGARPTADRLGGGPGAAGILATAGPRSWRDSGLCWRGYVERHAIGDAGRKRDGTGRVTTAPAAQLATPEDVVDWIRRRFAEIDTTADPHARRLNALRLHRWSVHRRVAAAGRSVYTSVHLRPGQVVDLCAEAVPADDHR